MFRAYQYSPIKRLFLHANYYIITFPLIYGNIANSLKMQFCPLYIVGYKTALIFASMLQYLVRIYLVVDLGMLELSYGFQTLH